MLREKLIERENEVSSLNRVQQELKENLLQAELTLDSVKTESTETRSEIQMLRSRLAKYEITFKTENGLLENEVNKQSEVLHLLKMEAEEVEVSRVGNKWDPLHLDTEIRNIKCDIIIHASFTLVNPGE